MISNHLAGFVLFFSALQTASQPNQETPSCSAMLTQYAAVQSALLAVV